MSPLLSADEPIPFEVREDTHQSPFLFTADHAGRYVPRKLGTLGVSDADMQRHIAWDIGIGAVARLLAERLGAFLILQPYSRLVIDCNRPPESDSSIAEISEHTEIPGNRGLSADERLERQRAVFDPYHRRIEGELTRREQSGQPTVVVALHSFTPRYKGSDRIWESGVLYNRDPRLALRLLDELLAEGMVVGNNEPYFVSDESDYGIPRYGEQRGNLHVELEIRQDLIGDAEGQRRWCDILARSLPRAAAPFLADAAR